MCLASLAPRAATSCLDSVGIDKKYSSYTELQMYTYRYRINTSWPLLGTAFVKTIDVRALTWKRATRLRETTNFFTKLCAVLDCLVSQEAVLSTLTSLTDVP